MLFIEDTLLYHSLRMKKEKNILKTFQTQIPKFKILIFSIIFIVAISNKSYSDVLKPNKNISPKEVVKIQLNALMKNDSPYEDRGILQTWEFAHPNNQRFTGPIERFTIMLKGDSFSMLLNHKENEIVEIFKNENVATYEVTILGLIIWHKLISVGNAFNHRYVRLSAIVRKKTLSNF